MLVELSEIRVSKLIGFAAKRAEKTPVVKPNFPKVEILWDKTSDAQATFDAFMGAFAPQNIDDLQDKRKFVFLSKTNPTYHEANGFFFKINPVKEENGIRTYMIERRTEQHSELPLDRLEIVRNLKNPNDANSTMLSYRKQVGTDLISLSDKDEPAKVSKLRQTAESFVASMYRFQPRTPTEQA